MATADKLAAAEPARADYQGAVVISLMTAARYAGSEARALLERAASILRALDAEGRLPAVDRNQIDVVAEMLAALP